MTIEEQIKIIESQIENMKKLKNVLFPSIFGGATTK